MNTIDERILANILDDALDRHVEKISCKIDVVKERKEKLRIALVNAGFNIPQGLNLEEWVPYIESKVKA